MAQVEVLNIDTSSATNSLKSLRQELMAVKNEMTNLEEGSDAFLKAANKAGELKHQIDEINQSVSGASTDFGDMLGAATTALNGIIGGFTAAQGALSLFGIENEDVIKSIKQLQSLMAVGQGIAQIDTGIKAMNKLQHAIKGTSVAAKVLRGALTPKSMLLIIAALTTLTKLWEKFGDDIKNSIPLIGKVSKVFDTWNTSIEDNIKKQDELQQAVTDTQKKYNDLVKNDKISKLNENAKKSYDELAKSLEILYAKRDALTAQAKKAGSDGNRDLYNKLYNENAEIDRQISQLAKQQQAILDSADSYRELTKNVGESSKKLPAFMGILSDTMKRYKDAVDNAKNSASSWFTDLDTWNAKLEQQYKAGEISEEEYYNGLLDNAKRALYAATEGTKEYYDALSNVEELQRQATDRQRETSLAKLDWQHTAGLISDSEYWNSAVSIEEEKLMTIEKGTEAYYKQLLVIEQLRNEANRSTTEMQAGWQDWSMVAQAGIGGVANVLYGLADLQDTTTEEGIQKQAQYQYMAAIMNTANAIIGAWTSAMTLPAPASFILGGIQTAAAAAMGGIEIAKIRKAAEQAKAGLSGSSASVNNGALSSAIIAPIQYSSATQGAQLQSTITDTRVYVTEGDITRTQNKVHVAESENRF